MAKDVVSTNVSYAQSGSEITSKDTTEHHGDGSSTTTHQEARFSLGSVNAGAITGVTENSADGISTHKPR